MLHQSCLNWYGPLWTFSSQESFPPFTPLATALHTHGSNTHSTFFIFHSSSSSPQSFLLSHSLFLKDIWTGIMHSMKISVITENRVRYSECSTKVNRIQRSVLQWSQWIHSRVLPSIKSALVSPANRALWLMLGHFCRLKITQGLSCSLSCC